MLGGLVNLVEMRSFAAVAERGSFAGAAKQLGYARSTVCHQLANLEHDLGARLLERGPSGVVLTEAGETALPFVYQIMRVLELAEHAVRGVSRQVHPGQISPTSAASSPHRRTP